MTTPLIQLEREISAAVDLNLTPGPEALERWRQVVRSLLAVEMGQWEKEPRFRLRTGASLRWCQGKFTEYRGRGLAKLGAHGERVWHVSARPTRAAGNLQSIEDEIVSSIVRAG